MSTFEARISKPDYKRWLKAGLCLGYLKEGLLPFINRESQDLHSDVIAYVRQNTPGPAAVGPVPQCRVCTAQDIGWDNRSGKWEVWYTDPTTNCRVKKCPNHICHHYVSAIVKQHKLARPKGMNWSNCDVGLWYNSHWNVSKALLDKMEDGINKSTPKDCDCSSLLKFVEYATRCASKISINDATKVREHRNEIMHSMNMELTGARLIQMADDMIGLLKSLVDYNSCLDAQQAVSDIEKARDTSIEITATDEIKVMCERMCDLVQKMNDMDESLDKLKDDCQQTRLDFQQVSGDQQEDLDKHTIKIQEFTQKLADQTRNYEQVQRDIQNMQKIIAQNADSAKTMKTQFIGVNTRLTSLSKELDKTRLEVERCSSLYSSLSSEVQQLEGAVSNIEQRMYSVERESGQVGQLKSTVEGMDNKIEELQTAVGGVNQRLKMVEQKIDTSESVSEFKDLQKTLIELYKDKSFSEVQVSPLDEMKIPIDKIYTKLVIVEETVDMTKEGEKEPIEKELCSYRDMFYDGNKRRKHVAVLGSAGKGKTTFCHQLAHLWCKVHEQESSIGEQTSRGASSREESRSEKEWLVPSRGKIVYGKGVESDKSESLRQFDYLLLIHLRLVKGPTSVYDAICSTLLKQHARLHGTVKKVLEQHPEKVLVICDGFDEYHDENPPSRELLHGCTVLTTTRPWKYECLKSSDSRPDVALQLKGLKEEGVEELTERMMVHFNEKEGKAKARQCIQDIRKAKLAKTAQIPLILTYLVHLWYFTKSKLSESITVNLTELILCIVQKGHVKIKGDPNLKTLLAKCSKDLPGALHNEPELESFGSLLLCVAKLAFEGLISKTKEDSLIFRGRTLDKYFSNPLEKEACFKFGLLSETKIFYERRISTAVSFYHKLVQEFFSAVHAVYLEQNFQELCKFCDSTDKILDMENVYLFISGLNPEMGGRFSKHIAEVTSSNFRVTNWRKGLLRDGFWYGNDTVGMLMDLHVHCLQEVQYSSYRTDHVFYIPDICVVFDTPSYMKCLLHNARQTVVNIDIDHVTLTEPMWKLLQQVISESPLQKLRIENVTVGGDKVNKIHISKSPHSHSVSISWTPATLWLPLLTRVRSTTTVTQQYNSGGDGDCPGGLTSVTTGTLTHLELKYVTMTRCEWDMLVNIVRESPSFQVLTLKDITKGTPTHLELRDVTPMPRCEWEMLVNIVRESPSLQALRLEEVTEGGDMVIKIHISKSPHSHSVSIRRVPATLWLPLLTRVRSTTTVTQQYNSGGDGDCPGGLTSVTTGTPTHLELRDVTMPRCEWDMLVNIVRESPSLQTLRLEDITIGGDKVDEIHISKSPHSHSVSLRSGPVPLLLPLLTCVRSTTTVTQQDNSGSDGDCTGGLTSVTTGTLTHLELKYVTMTRCEWDVLVNIARESPSLQTLRLENVTVGGDKVNKIHISKSPHSHSVSVWRVPTPLWLPLLTCVRSTTTVTQQYNSGGDGDCPGGLTPVTTGTLTHLELGNVTMTRCEWDVLVNIVRESPSLQTLRLEDITIGGDKVDEIHISKSPHSHSVSLRSGPVPLLLPLLTCVRSTTTVTQQDNSGSDGDCTGGLTSVTTGTLTHLELGIVTMTRCEWDMLVNIVRESPSLQTLKLRDISINDRGAGSDGVGGNALVYDVNSITSCHSALQRVELLLVCAPLLPLLTFVRSTTTVTQQDNSGSDGDCPGGLTSVTTGTLTLLELEYVTMTRCEWDMLVNTVRESPSLQTLELQDISIDGEEESTDCWRQMCDTAHSSKSLLWLSLLVHKTIASMEEWRTFTQERWHHSSEPCWWDRNYIEIKLYKM